MTDPTHGQQHERPRGFGRRNPHCTNCGDERGGPFGHEISECRYRDGMTVEELVQLPHLAGRQGEVWDHYVDRYMAGALDTPGQDGQGDTLRSLRKIPVETLLGAIDNALRNGSYMTGANLAFNGLCDRYGVDRGALTFDPHWAQQAEATEDGQIDG